MAVCALAMLAGPASAHFLQIIPSEDVLPDGGSVTIDLTFTHPMEQGPVMDMAPPARVGVLKNGVTTDLASGLRHRPVDDRSAWSVTHDLGEPGAGVFYAEMQPYWEPSEGRFIIHHAKVIVDSYASGDGWDALVGLPVEIMPLVRPTGLWTGSAFRGIVLKAGKPAPFAEIEIEFINDGSVTPPNEAFITQVIRANAGGEFSYTMPRAGWWGFAALIEADAPMMAPDGTGVPAELGALIWVRTTDMGGE